MNIVKIMLLCAVLCFAQQLRGFAYNPYGTLGAPPTISDILQKPSDIYLHKFVYVSPADGSGYSAFDLAGGSALLGFDNSLMLGYAKSFYGLLLRVSPYKYCDRNDNDSYECSSNQDIGLSFSMPLGNSILYAYTGKFISSDYSDEDDEDIISSKYETSVKKAYIGIKGGNTLVWDLRLGVERYKTSYYGYGFSGFTPYEFKFSNYLTNTEFLFNFGYKIVQNDRLKFIIGSNNALSCDYSSYSYADNSQYNLLATISPNFLGEIALTEHLLAFVGASYDISYLMLLSQNDSTQIEGFAINNYEPGAYAGLRYEYKNWAIETLLASDAFGELLDRKNPFISLGFFFFFQQGKQ